MATLEELEALEKSEKAEKEKYERGFESEGYRFSQFLLEDNMDNVPEGVAQQFWPFFDKELALSNFTETDARILMSELKIAILDLKMEIPDYKKDLNTLKHLDLLRVKSFAKIKRATGGTGRERALFATQIRQFLTSEEERPKGGFLSKVSSIFRGRR
jgi:hypothetical protein